jgi:hypothetical protein
VAPNLAGTLPARLTARSRGCAAAHLEPRAHGFLERPGQAKTFTEPSNVFLRPAQPKKQPFRSSSTKAMISSIVGTSGTGL